MEMAVQLNRFREAFRTDSRYADMAKRYTRVDAAIALALYAALMFLYYAAGIVYDQRRLDFAPFINLALAAVCIVIVTLRRQPVSTLGFTKRNIGKSILLGLVPSALLLGAILAVGISGGQRFNRLPIIAIRFVYYLLIIALTEEVIFRGLIQTRIRGIIRNPVLAVAVTGFLFMAMHVPFQMGLKHMGFIAYIAGNYVTLLFTFMWHIVFDFMYRKYNSIAAPLVFHTFLNWSNVLFR